MVYASSFYVEMCAKPEFVLLSYFDGAKISILYQNLNLPCPVESTSRPLFA